MGDYVDVNARIALFKEKYPEGSLQPADPERPFGVTQVGDKLFISYAAAAYRTPDDVRPGIGCAWEPVPGKTNFTRDSELQNAETSAWGRAIVAALAADTKKGIASAEEVRNRTADREAPDTPQAMRARIWAAAKAKGWEQADVESDFAQQFEGASLLSASLANLTAYALMLETGEAA